MEVMFALKVASWGLGFGRVGFEGLPLSSGYMLSHVNSFGLMEGCWQVWLGFVCGVESGLGICIREVHIGLVLTGVVWLGFWLCGWK